MNMTRVGHYVRWTGWAVLWLIYHPEMKLIYDWENTPAAVASSIAMYFASGVILELVYRVMVWRGIGARLVEPVKVVSLDSSWTLISETPPPAYSVIEVFCSDGIVRIAETQDTGGGKMFMTIDYETTVKKRMQLNPGNHRPTHWRLNIPF
jgi:hypothetical protein